MFPDELLERNRKWSGGRAAKPLPAAEAVRLAVVSCFDPRLDPMLRPALGLEEGQGFLMRTGGARLAPDGDSLRALAMAVYMFQVREILVLGHSSCRMAAFDSSEFADIFRARGVTREAFGDQDLRTWAGALASPRQGVVESVEAIASAPFLPPDLQIAGALLDDTTGRIDLVLGPDEPLPGQIAEPPRPAPSTSASPSPEAIAEVASPPDEPPAASAGEPAPPPPPAALQPVVEAVSFLTSQSRMYPQLAQLRRQLQQEKDPVRQVGLIQEFVKSGAADSSQLRDAFARLRQEVEAQAPGFVSRVFLPLLHKEKR